MRRIIPKGREYAKTKYSPDDFEKGQRVRLQLEYHSPRYEMVFRQGVIINPSAQEDLTRAFSNSKNKVLELRVEETLKGRLRRMPRKYDYFRIRNAWILE
jgi:hypothetical protein